MANRQGMKISPTDISNESSSCKTETPQGTQMELPLVFAENPEDSEIVQYLMATSDPAAEVTIVIQNFAEDSFEKKWPLCRVPVLVGNKITLIYARLPADKDGNLLFTSDLAELSNAINTSNVAATEVKMDQIVISKPASITNDGNHVENGDGNISTIGNNQHTLEMENRGEATGHKNSIELELPPRPQLLQDGIAARPALGSRFLAFLSARRALELEASDILNWEESMIPKLSKIRDHSGNYVCPTCFKNEKLFYRLEGHFKIHFGKRVHNCKCDRCRGIPYRCPRIVTKFHNAKYLEVLREGILS